MVLLKKWARHKVKSYTYCVNQFLPEKHQKEWNQECKQKQSLMFNFYNIFDLLTSWTQKIAWWPPVFKHDFCIFPYNDPPDIKTSWRRRSDVAATSLCTSQWRRRYVSNETPNDASMERRQDVSVVRLYDVLLERHSDVSKGRNNDAPSLRLHDF